MMVDHHSHVRLSSDGGVSFAGEVNPPARRTTPTGPPASARIRAVARPGRSPRLDGGRRPERFDRPPMSGRRPESGQPATASSSQRKGAPDDRPYGVSP